MLAKLEAAKGKLIVVGLLIVLVLVAYMRYESKNTKIDELKTENITTKVENGALKETVKDQKESAAITEAVNTEVKKESTNLNEKAKVIRQDTAAKIKQVDKDYEKLPETIENQVAKDIAKSEVIADGMWKNFCAAKPDAEECVGAKP